ncbi:MAG: DUF502 domain-containing protein [Synergistaceae bacterium]|jgi:uncharacterized membrane protein|nr:DUF502 domain-containing protein [Synergistaceae bacterium]
MENDKEQEKRTAASGSKLVRIAKDFFLGCIAFIPLTVFVFIFYYLILFSKALGRMIFGLTESVETTVAITIIIVIMLIYTGRKLRRREKWFLTFVDQVISKIPVIGGWYSTFQDMVRTLTTGSGERGYLGTARVPCGEGYMIGFVTKRETEEDGSTTVTIFVPTSPNPTTGLVLFFPEERIKIVDITPEKAFAKIISLGMK